jgi:hypothetical protein
MTEQDQVQSKGLKVPAWVLLVGAFAILIAVGITMS